MKVIVTTTYYVLIILCSRAINMSLKQFIFWISVDHGDLVPNGEVNQQLEHRNQLTQLPIASNCDKYLLDNNNTLLSSFLLELTQAFYVKQVTMVI